MSIKFILVASGLLLATSHAHAASVSASKLKLPGKPSLGGNYWDVPLPTASGGRVSGLFGFADLHTHFFQQLGAGGRMFHGSIHSCINSRGEKICSTASSPAKALPECGDSHGRHGDGVTTVVVEQGHNRAGYPYFRGWPRSTTLSHQQMYVDWLRRAWQGGLRVVQMDVGHSAMFGLGYDLTGIMLPGNRMPNPWKDDEWNIVAQVKATKAFATLPDVKKWLEIAYSPKELRRIVGEGKLAVVLGVEVDDFGRFNSSKTFWARSREADPKSKGVTEAKRQAARTWIRGQVRPYLKKLHDMGVRHFFPIHALDSVFGGAAVYDLKLEAGTYLFHRIFGAGGRFSELRGDGHKDGIYNRMDMEFVEIRSMVDDLLSNVKLAEVFTNPAVVLALLPVALPIVAPILGLLGPVLGTIAAGALPILATTVHFLAKAILNLENKLGIRKVLKQRVDTLPKSILGKAVGLANARGLSTAGEILVEEIMRLGWLLDVSHMSDLATNATLKMAKDNAYPVQAGHTGFRDTTFGAWVKSGGKWKRNPGTYWTGKGSRNTFDTASSDALANERSLSLKQIKEIDALGGMIGIGTGSAGAPVSWGNKIPADCDGSTKRFAQDYKYLLEHLRTGGVALGTDANGFAGGFKPRFGTHACGAASGDELRVKRVTDQARAQKNGVRYAESHVLPLWDRFDGPVTLQSLPPPPDDLWNFMGQLIGGIARDLRPAWQQIQEDEQAIWMAAATFNAGLASKGDKPFGCDAGNRGRDRDMQRTAWGFRRAADGKPRPGNDCVFDTDTNADSKAAWDAFKGNKSNWQDAEKTKRVMNIWAQWKKMRGDNPPLEKSIMDGEVFTPFGKQKVRRDFDFNLDGLAHYGLLPDMLQDLRNIGVRAHEMAPLFRGAEAYARMWEKVSASAEVVRKKLK